MKTISRSTYRKLAEIQQAIEDAVETLGEIDLGDITRPEAACGDSYIRWWNGLLHQTRDATRAMVSAQRAYDRHNDIKPSEDSNV